MVLAFALIRLLDGWGLGVYQAFAHAPAWEAFFKAVTALGSAAALIPACLAACLVLFLFKRRYEALHCAASLLGIWLLNLALKQIFARTRPDVIQMVVETSYSFPSAHAMVAMGFWPVAAFIAARKCGRRGQVFAQTASIVLCLLIALSRVTLGVHYLSDVILGLALGFVWSALSIRILKRRGKRASPYLP